MERWAEQVAAEAGFTDVGHTVELFGLCPDCGAAAAHPANAAEGQAAAENQGAAAG